MLKISLLFAHRGARLFLRVARVGLLLLFVAGAATVLVSRYWLLPNIGRYHDQIAYALGSAVGRPATIGRVEANWHGFRPHLVLGDVRFLDRSGVPALALERVETDVAWTSLFVRQFRLYSLTLIQPDLLVKRDAQGEVFIAGMAVSGGASASNGNAADWLLNQSRIEVRNARITWLDERRGVPPLVFTEVNLLIDNGWHSHRFALRALPPKALSAQVDVRGDFHGASFGALAGWNGELFAQLDYADVAAWRTWVTLPIALGSGKGAVRGWLDVDRGNISQATADLALSGVRTRLADDLPMIDLRTLHGRVGWRDVENGIEVYTQKLSLRLRNGFALEPTDFYLRYAGAHNAEPASGQVRANRLDLLGLATLSEYLPFDRSFKRKLAAFAPRGRVSDLYANWQGDADNLQHFNLKSRFDGMALKPVGGIPGFSGLTGRVDGNDNSGGLSLNSQRLTLDAPGVMAEKLQFDSVSGEMGWQSGGQGLELTFSNIAIANADMNGILSGTYHTVPNSPGAVDITGRFTHAAAHHVDRYIPIGALNRQTHAWLNSGLVGGRSDEASLRLSGDLKKFPFPGGRDGLFQVRARVRDATVEFLRDWPRIEDINGELLIEGQRLEVNAPTAATAGNSLQKVSVVIPDLTSPDLSIKVYGEAIGETARALRYIEKSPVRGLLGGFTDGASALGNGELKLRLDIPLLGGKPLKVNGSYRFIDDDIDLGGGIPLLQQVSGELAFSESSVSSRNLALRTLGGPAAIEVGSGDDGRVIRVNASGTSDMDALRRISPHPLLRYLHGGSPWDLSVTVQNRRASVLFTSSLAGLVSNLPAPFAKRADETIPLRIEQRQVDDHSSELSAQYGTLVTAQMLRYRENGEWKVQSGVVGFGKPKKWPEREGLWLAGELPQLSLEGWMPLLQGTGGDSGGGFDGADVTIRKVTGYRQAIDNLHVSAHRRDGRVYAQLASKEISGDIVWQPQDKGALKIILKNLALGAGPKEDPGAGKPLPVPEDGSGESPEIYCSADSFSFKGKQLGRLEMQAKQRAGNWLLERVKLNNPEGTLTADGTWLTKGATPQTQLNVKLDIADAGGILSRAGYVGAMNNAGGTLQGSLSWYGSPGDFNYTALGGKLNLALGKGQFLKIGPETSGLLRILSLQAFRFADVFSRGFVFDSINGNALINQGVLSTTDFRIDGAAANVRMTGAVDLNRETQNLNIVIQPQLRSGTTILIAIAGTPIGALGYWFADKILGSPVEKAVSVDFNVTGTWADPIVSKAGQKK